MATAWFDCYGVMWVLMADVLWAAGLVVSLLSKYLGLLAQKQTTAKRTKERDAPPLLLSPGAFES